MGNHFEGVCSCKGKMKLKNFKTNDKYIVYELFECPRCRAGLELMHDKGKFKILPPIKKKR